jgi:DNA-binding transcriptional LysR family regulator
MNIELRHLRYFVAVAEAVGTRLLTAFERAYPEVRMRIRSFDMTQPSAGLLDHRSDVAFAPGVRHFVSVSVLS